MFFLPKLFFPLVIKCGKLKIPYKRRCITLGEPSNQMGDFPARRVWLEGIKREGFGAIGLHIPYKMICLWGAFRNRSTNRFQFVDICGFWMVVLRYIVLMLFLRWPEKCFPSVMFSDTFGMAETPIRLISDSIDGRFQPPSHFFFFAWGKLENHQFLLMKSMIMPHFFWKVGSHLWPAMGTQDVDGFHLLSPKMGISYHLRQGTGHGCSWPSLGHGSLEVWWQMWQMWHVARRRPAGVFESCFLYELLSVLVHTCGLLVTYWKPIGYRSYTPWLLHI